VVRLREVPLRTSTATKEKRERPASSPARVATEAAR
jgi:hypothetical protein